MSQKTYIIIVNYIFGEVIADKMRKSFFFKRTILTYKQECFPHHIEQLVVMNVWKCCVCYK